MSDDQERPSAVLTNAQRAWLRGEKEYQPAAERDLRSRVRNRIRTGIQDFALIFDRLDMADIRTALETPAQDEIAIEDGLTSMIALMYLFYEEHGKLSWGTTEDLFAKRIESAIVLALNQVGESATAIDVNIEVDRGDPLDDLLGKEIRELSQSELDQLLRADKITPEEYGRAVLGMADEQDFSSSRE